MQNVPHSMQQQTRPTPQENGDTPALPTTWHKTRVTVMGLGSFGGGVGLTRYLAHQGAHVTVTDLQRDEAPTHALAALHALPIRFVLGGHHERDFCETDVVFVNPAVPLTSPYLQLARGDHHELRAVLHVA